MSRSTVNILLIFIELIAFVSSASDLNCYSFFKQNGKFIEQPHERPCLLYTRVEQGYDVQGQCFIKVMLTNNATVINAGCDRMANICPDTMTARCGVVRAFRGCCCNTNMCNDPNSTMIIDVIPISTLPNQSTSQNEEEVGRNVLADVYAKYYNQSMTTVITSAAQTISTANSEHIQSSS